ncbi:MAG: hypothetical protein EOM24_13975, partial [Chloroflexia bacterium]|nr:hypothetical protein [Chloroflexia bacterium]
MRIAYFLRWEAHWGQGILKKVLNQASYWVEAGHDVRLFMLSPEREARQAAAQINPTIAVTVRRHANLVDRFIQYGPLVNMAITWQPDLVYIRFAGYYFDLARLARRLPAVLEINTNDLDEYRLYSWYHNLYNRLTRHRLLQHARGMVFVTNELMHKPSFRCFGKPGLVLANGIDLSAYPPGSPPNNATPRIAFIGSIGAPWHGVDKIRWLAEMKPGWNFDIIGSTSIEMRGTIPPNVQMHGL